MYTRNDVVRFVEKNRAALRQAWKEQLAVMEAQEPLPRGFKTNPIAQASFFAMTWMCGALMQSHGAKVDELEPICTLHGSRSMANEPYRLAVSYANQFVADRKVSQKDLPSVYQSAASG